MKVALYNLTTTTQYGGVESFVWEVGKRLAAQRVDVVLIGGTGPIRRYPALNIVTFPFLARTTLRRLPGLAKQYTATKLAERLHFGLKALPYLLRARFDVIHIQKPYDLPIAAWVKRRVGSKIVFGCHGTDFFSGDRWFASSADIAVSCSAFNARQVYEHYGILPRVVYNGIDPAQFFPQPPDAALRRARADAATVLYAGRLVRWKGVQYLIDAIAWLNRSRDTHLLIAGEGEYRPALERRAQQQGVADRVHFLGYLAPEVLPRYYALADVAAIASYANETFSIMAAEAMACGRAVVGTRFGGIPEVIADEKTGLLAAPENAEDLAQKLARLLDDPELRERYGQCGRQRVLDLFTWDKVTARVLDAYHLTFQRSNVPTF